jgi:hypothetical protein
MRKCILPIFALLFFSLATFAQSAGMYAMKQRFKGADDVHHFKVGGALARMAFKFIDDQEFKEAVQEIKSVEFITIPREHFQREGVTIRGYQKFLEENHFDELMQVRDNHDNVSVYLAPESTSKYDRYLILVDNQSEVVLIELRGRIDPTKLSSTKINTTQL